MDESPGRMPATAGRGDLRASNADRERVIGTLKAAFVQGRLAKDEFDLRVGEVLVSRTYADLAAVTADLPAGLSASQPPELVRVRGEARGQRPALRRPRTVMAVATVLYLGTWPVAFFLPSNNEGYPLDGVNLVGSATLFYILVMVSACVWVQALGSRQEEQGRACPLRGGASRHYGWLTWQAHSRGTEALNDAGTGMERTSLRQGF